MGNVRYHPAQYYNTDSHIQHVINKLECKEDVDADGYEGPVDMFINSFLGLFADDKVSVDEGEEDDKHDSKASSSLQSAKYLNRKNRMSLTSLPVI